MVLEATARPGQSALKFHNARLFLAGQGLSNIGTFSQIVALSLLVLQLTDSGLALGAVMAAQALPMLLLAPWAGSFLDRVPLRRVLFVTALLGAVQAACLAVLALTGTINLAWVFGLALGLGCIQVFDRPGSQAFIAELVPREAIAGAVGLASSAQAMGRLGGPALAAVLYAWAGAGSVFAVNATSFAAVLVALALLRSSELLPRAIHSSKRTDMSTALRFAWRSPPVRSALIANAFIGLLAFNFPTFFASISSLTFDQPSLFGAAESINAVTAIAAGVLLARQVRRPTLRTVGIAGVCLGSSLAWVALSPTGTVFLAAMPYFGFAVVWYGTSSQTLIQQHSPAEMGGRMMSLYTLGSMGTTPLGALIVGAVIDRWSPRLAIGLGASSAVVAGVALFLIATRARPISPLPEH
ncbi:MAG: MFS transporter [Chloroflexota bacterium]|nr:MFS transporter [Chloroflexota bacterium]